MDGSSAGGKATVMIVDDYPQNLKLLEIMLSHQGYQVNSFPSGELALKSAKNGAPDIVLLDIDMPGMDGYEVCRRMKADPELIGVPIIFLSGLTELEDKIKAFEVGGLDYIPKPFHFPEVKARIETQLKLRRLQIESDRYNNELQELVKEKIREIMNSQLATIRALSTLAEFRDEETGNHILRVQRYCKALAIELSSDQDFKGQITDRFIEDIFHASPMHDIGKVGIPDSILLKPGRLTMEEFVVMKTHTTLGADTLSAVYAQYPGNNFVSMGIELARYHHERWDGSGYPDGLAGEDIPLPARILMISDQYDALRSTRPYKPPFDAEKSYKIMVEGDDRSNPNYFDSRVLAAFKRVVSQYEAIFDELGG